MKGYKQLLWISVLCFTLSCGGGDDGDMLPNGNNNNNGTMDRCENVMATLSGHVLPIINTNCAIAGCHVSGAQAPDLTNKNNIISNAALIRNQTESGNMPEASSGLTLTAQQKTAIFCWVERGAPDN